MVQELDISELEISELSEHAIKGAKAFGDGFKIVGLSVIMVDEETELQVEWKILGEGYDESKYSNVRV